MEMPKLLRQIVERFAIVPILVQKLFPDYFSSEAPHWPINVMIVYKNFFETH